jgi:hypothetical protein
MKAPTIAKRKSKQQKRSGVQRLWLENGLSIIIFIFFLLFLSIESVVGWHAYNAQRTDHGKATVTYTGFLRTGRFVEATTENWESEFLEMAAFVWLTSFLYQKGSAQSKDPYDTEEESEQPERSSKWVRAGGWRRKVYENSLTLALLAMFMISFFLHAAGGAAAYSEEQTEHGQPGVTMIEYLGTAEFWFESMQNWQSEFLGIFAMVVLSVFLRQKGSAESKPVGAPDGKTKD